MKNVESQINWENAPEGAFHWERFPNNRCIWHRRDTNGTKLKDKAAPNFTLESRRSVWKDAAEQELADKINKSIAQSLGNIQLVVKTKNGAVAI